MQKISKPKTICSFTRKGCTNYLSLFVKMKFVLTEKGVGSVTIKKVIEFMEKDTKKNERKGKQDGNEVNLVNNE